MKLRDRTFYDPEIPRFQTVAMQRLSDAVSQGYRHHTGGIVSAEKAQKMVAKFAALYGLDLTANERWRQKKVGRANTRLIIYPDRGAAAFRWWLLATPGDGPVHASMQLLDAGDRRQALTWGDRYELVQLPRKGGPARWTWRMTDLEREAWEERIRAAIRNRGDDDLLRQAIWSLQRIPGFAGLRDQVKLLRQEISAEWRRSRADADAMPAIPAFLGYVRKTSCEAFPLSQVARRLGRGAKPFPRQQSTSPQEETAHEDAL